MNIFDVPKFPERFFEAVKKQDETRAEALFLEDIPVTLCGVGITPMNIKHLLLLEYARKDFISPNISFLDAVNVVHLLSKKRFPRVVTLARVYLWGWRQRRFNAFSTLSERVTEEVFNYMDAQTMDMIGRYSDGNDNNSFVSPLEVSRSNTVIAIIARIMDSYPSLTLTEVKNMPLSLLWQFYRLSIQKENPEYIGGQPSDLIKTWGLSELRRLRQAESAS